VAWRILGILAREVINQNLRLLLLQVILGPSRDVAEGSMAEGHGAQRFLRVGGQQIQPSVPSGEITNTGFPSLRAKRTVDHVPERLCSLASLGAAISMSVSRTMSLQRLR